MPPLLGLLAALGVAAASGQDQSDRGHAMNDGPPKHTNRLLEATSPYLLQHAHNPVDWYEWGPEALDKARSEGKPIFLSIGYSACHWCHVMAHESFENEAIAAAMNRLFVNIKVDREERPDLDEIYMRATVLMNQGQGGWPMSVWLTPDCKPFFAGTYFPPTSRFGRPGFGELCERIGQLWETRREDLQADAGRLAELVDQQLRGDLSQDDGLGLPLIDQVVVNMARSFDQEKGGISGGGPNKFPPSMALELFLRFLQRNPQAPEAAQVLAVTRLTLDRMARGGIYDHLAGGIHRYSTDVDWLVPHFEKMLYDQALVSRAYIDAWQFSGDPFYAETARSIFDYVLADLQSVAGGIYSTRDADSEGREGKYYVWTNAELQRILGADAERFGAYYGFAPGGNWDDPHEPGVEKNILHVTQTVADFATQRGVDPAEVARTLADGRRKLLAARAERVAPGLDDKVLVEWNGMMIASLARGGAALGEEKYIEAARRAADFLLTHQVQDGRIVRAWRDGRKLEMAFLTDYACLIDGLLELYEATFEQRWLDAAVDLNAAAIEHFWDAQRGGFFFTPDDHETLITRSKDVRDNATPSGNSVQLGNLLRLAAMRGDNDLREKAERTIRGLGSEVRQAPGASDRFLAAVELARSGPLEIAIVGDPAVPATRALLREIRRSYIPNRIIMLRRPDGPAPVGVPLLADRGQIDGQPTVYLCRDYACRLPVTSVEALRGQLKTELGGTLRQAGD